jgi:hypothetical protein
VACNDQTVKLLMEYETVSENVLFVIAVLTALMSGRKYDSYLKTVTFQENNVCTLVFRNKVITFVNQCGKDPPSAGAI